MTKNSWRPEGFRNPYKNILAGDSWMAYEAGASAMLEELRKMGSHTVRHLTEVDIPDDPEPEKKEPDSSGIVSYTLICEDCGCAYMSDVAFPDVPVCEDCFERGTSTKSHPATLIEKGYFCPICGDKYRHVPCSDLVWWHIHKESRGISY